MEDEELAIPASDIDPTLLTDASSATVTAVSMLARFPDAFASESAFVESPSPEPPQAISADFSWYLSPESD